jgi:phosphonopyruvate decarboxylase
MLDINQLGAQLRKRGFNFFSGVPCSFLKDLINYAINKHEYVIATNEGEAVAISAGAYMAGKKSCVVMQNSGLTNALNPLTSLNYCFRIPVLGFMSWRGEPILHDEPEHTLMGEITSQLLELCRIPHVILSTDSDELNRQFDKAEEYINNNEPFFFIVKKNTFSEEKAVKRLSFKTYEKLITEGQSVTPEPTRLQVIQKILATRDKNTLLLASTGKGGRELFEEEDSPNHLYMVGSMGCVSSIGLGISMVNHRKRIIALDGDGALLMRMGSLATNGYYRPKNLLHVLLDNGSHDSTGGQQTVSHNVGFAKIAHEAGYDQSIVTNNLDDILQCIQKWKQDPVLTFLHVRIRAGSKANLGRPTVKPFEVKERLMSLLKETYPPLSKNA